MRISNPLLTLPVLAPFLPIGVRLLSFSSLTLEINRNQNRAYLRSLNL